MNLTWNVSLEFMMMNCPRCGFSQPQDRFCAQCGVDVQTFRAKPKPILTRLAENSNFHILLAIAVISLSIGYILYSRVDVVSREVSQLLGTPLSSRNSSIVENKSPVVPIAAVATSAPAVVEPATDTEDDVDDRPKAVPAAAVESAAVEPQKLEVSFWEISRDQMPTLTAGGERTGEGNEGKAFDLHDSTKLVEVLKNARRVSPPRHIPLQTGGQSELLTPPTTPEPLQFGLALQITKFENKEATLQWSSQLVLSMPESPQEMASPIPTLKPLVETSLSGTVKLSAGHALVLIIEPGNHHPRDEYLAKAGEGPWSIFDSDEFRGGVTEWVIVIQPK